jgi:hypothetical protein
MLFYENKTVKMLVFKILLLCLCVWLHRQIKMQIEGSYNWLWYILFIAGILLPNLKYPPSKRDSKKQQ